MTEPRVETRARAAFMVGCFFAVSFVPLAIWILATPQTPGQDPIEIGLSNRIGFIAHLFLGPIALIDPIIGSGVVIVAIVWSAALVIGIVCPRVGPLRFLSCLAAIAWPLPAVTVWAFYLA